MEESAFSEADEEIIEDLEGIEEVCEGWMLVT